MRSKFSLWILLIFVSCAGGTDSAEPENQVLSAELPTGFDEFYFDFHNDSSFQVSHIVFPLNGQSIMQDSMETLSIDKVYLQGSWKLHQPFKANAGFSRNFIVLGDLVIEKMSDDMGLLSIERRWGKVDTTWSLIYYGTTERKW